MSGVVTPHTSSSLWAESSLIMHLTAACFLIVTPYKDGKKLRKKKKKKKNCSNAHTLIISVNKYVLNGQKIYSTVWFNT